MLSQELADNYPRIQECLGAAQRNVADLDTERLDRRAEGSEEEEPEGPEASDAAKREAERLGVDLSQVDRLWARRPTPSAFLASRSRVRPQTERWRRRRNPTGGKKARVSRPGRVAKRGDDPGG